MAALIELGLYLVDHVLDHVETLLRVACLDDARDFV
jgi:hypothetical protein